MDDLGPPIAYTVLAEGTPVYDRNGERIGVVDHVLADMQLDIFEGVIVHTLPLPGRHLFADVDQIDELHERGVLLSVARDELHEPPDEPARKRPTTTGWRARSRRGCAAPGTGSAEPAAAGSAGRPRAMRGRAWAASTRASGSGPRGWAAFPS